MVAVALGACASVPRTANPLFDLDGVWEGHIEGFPGPELLEEKLWSHDLRLTIDGKTADVSFRWEEGWRDHGKFRVARHQTNAVLWRIHSGGDEECAWTETWSFTVSQEVADTLRVYWYRIVNNQDCTDKKYGYGAFAAAGRLTRTS